MFSFKYSINKTSNATLINEAYEICVHLPDATNATTYLLAEQNPTKNNNRTDNDNINDGDKGSSSRSTAFTAIIFIAVLLAQHFS